jgi:uncharacterized membrane protein (UPF0182 family)
MAQVMVTRRRRWLFVVAGVVVAILVGLNVLSGFYVDLLWFREVSLSSVFWTVFWTKLLLGLVFGAAFFVLLLVNLLIVRRLTPAYRVLTPEQEVIERYRVAVEPYIKWILPALSAVIALFVGIASAGQWQRFLLWRDSGSVAFGQPEQLFGRDPAYYIFKLPFLHFVQGWLFSSLVAVAVMAAIAHYVWGGIRTQAIGERVTPQVKAHMSVLLGLIFLVKAWGYYLGRFDLLVSKRGVVTGASYTDVHVQSRALIVLLSIALLCAVIFFVNIRFKGWAFPAIAIGLLAVSSVLVGAIIPAAIQRFSVEPQELQREAPYIQRNIDATRRAFGLDRIDSTSPSVIPDVTQSEVSANTPTVSNIRLWDPQILKQNYDVLQRLRQYYEFRDVDVDRYTLDGEERMVMVSARQVSQNGIQSQAGTWQNRHLFYTHGFGAVASQVNTSSPEGQPLFILRDIPPQGQIPVSQPRVYYGEQEEVKFVVADSGLGELDYQGTGGNDQKQVTSHYAGKGGIPVGGFFGRLLFAWRYKDVNLLISGLMHGDSRMMIYRDIRERIPKPAPFLQYDGDPYAAVVNGRIVWIQDAYTTTNAYPYSQGVDLSDAPGNRLRGSANYIRNSVKVVVDAYDGTMTYYVVDPTDPIIQVWERAFPNLFTPVSEAPEALRAHFRYPEDLFFLQAEQYANYHVKRPEVFYGRQDFWAVPSDPAFSANTGNKYETALRPYYVLLQLPGEATTSFHLILPFTPAKRPNMVAFLAAGSDPANYGKLTSFEFPSGQNVDGPVQVFGRINQNREFSTERTLLGQGGSQIVFGNFLVIPIGNSFLYIQPVFVLGNQEGAFPELRRVVVVHGDSIGIGDTLSQALAESFGAPPPTNPNGEPPPKGTVSEQVAQLLAQALAHFQRADEALARGDLGTYQTEIQLAQALIKQANDLAAGTSPPASPSPSSTPTPTPTPTATK